MQNVRSEVERMLNVFFEAALSGYVSKNACVLKEPVSGAKVVRHSTSDGFSVEDRWWSGCADGFFGTMIMWHGASPVWQMSYRGVISAVCAPFLKCALTEAYRQKEFRGGRGPRDVRSGDKPGDFQYVNMLCLGTFASFAGEEYLYVLGRKKTKESAGYCLYQGGLVP